MDDRFEHDVFISYNRANKELVRKYVVEPLGEAHVRVCWDEFFPPHQSTLESIDHGINSSCWFLVLLTKEYGEATTGFLKHEADVAITRDVRKRSDRIILIKYGDANVPPEFSTHNYLEAQNEDELGKAVSRVIDLVRPNSTPTPAVRFEPGGRVLAVGAHWDDILLGCLGFLMKLKRFCSYEVDVLVLCTSYNEHYYGAPQQDFDMKARSVYQNLCKECGFRNLDEVLHEELEKQDKPLQDRSLREEAPLIGRVFVDVIERSKKSIQGPYNLILCPPMDDMNEDHAAVGRAVFSQFRDPEHTVLEYPIKRYTDRVFVPNLCVGLDDRVGKGSETHGVADEKVRILNDVCQITGNICNSERLFDANALRARMKMHAIDYAKNKLVEYAEVFRGRLEL